MTGAELAPAGSTLCCTVRGRRRSPESILWRPINLVHDSEASSPNGSMPLNVMAQGDDVIVLLPDGMTLRMSAHHAAVSAQRLIDAANIAQRQLPKNA